MSLRTTDLYESGYFMCRGARLADTTLEERRRPTVVFTFEEPKNGEPLSKLQDIYHGNEATSLNLAEYRRNVEFLKDIVFQKVKELKANRGRAGLSKLIKRHGH